MLDQALSKGERTRANIRAAAYALFLEQGYAATSMRQIASRADLALSGIYNHFPAKRDIFNDVIYHHHPFHQVLPVLQSAPGETAEAFVCNAAHRMIAELGRRPDFVKLIFIELVEFEGSNLPGLFQMIFPQVLPLIQRFSDLGGELKPIPAPVLFRAFIGLFFSYYMTELLLSGANTQSLSENALDSFVDIFLHGILSEKA